MGEKLTAKQQEIFDFIKEVILKKGYPPTVREICERVNLRSTSSVHSHLESLEAKGYIRKDPTKPRAIEIVDEEYNLTRREMTSMPIVGRVAAGQPLLAVENIEDYFALPADFLPKTEELFVLKVKGDSMINAGIFDGDLLVVQKQNTARNGDIVVALLDDSVTVKRYYKEKDHIRLQPENDELSPIIVKDCVIEGKVIRLYRNNII